MTLRSKEKKLLLGASIEDFQLGIAILEAYGWDDKIIYKAVSRLFMENREPVDYIIFKTHEKKWGRIGMKQTKK